MRGPSYGGGKAKEEIVSPASSGGSSSVGPQGPAGSNGAQGPQGIQGIQGIAGPADRAAHTGTQAISTVTGLQTALDAKAPTSAIPNASYRVLLDSSGSHIAARVAGTYGLGQGNPAAISGTGTLYALNLIYIDSADYPTVNGLAPKLRVRSSMAINDVAPTGNFTFGLHPVTRPATSGGAGLCIYTIGAAVSGSTVLLTAPAADSMNNVASADFALPANGFYVLGFVSTGTVATSSHSHISMALQMRNN